jgi:dienelactone hydrolase
MNPQESAREECVKTQSVVALATWVLACHLLAASAIAAPASPDDRGPVPNTPFHRYTTVDSLGRTITFYLSEAQERAPAPLAVFVQGTGCASHFYREGGQIHQRSVALLYLAMRGRARVLAVEKPGVEFLDEQPDAADAKTCRPQFLAEHTLDRWTEAIVASIRAAQDLPGVDRSRTLVVGGSEGGTVAVHVSTVFGPVTHAASIAGGGPNPLFMLADYMRRKNLDPEATVYGCWADVLRDPDSTTKFCWGQPYRLWSGLMKTSLLQESLKSQAALYLIHGTADEQSPVAGFDMMRAELAARGRKAVFERIEGADHSLARKGEASGDGLLAAFGRIADWFLSPM